VRNVDRKIKILVLDDEVIVGERLKASLERAGFAVDAFVSSRDALDRLHEEHYDILVTDLKMSAPDGLEVLREARQLSPDIKSVVITGFATSDTAEEALRSGAISFIAKPFKMSQLKSLLIELSRTKDDTGG
jgi:DNA-binding NtrC family response regulator